MGGGRTKMKRNKASEADDVKVVDKHISSVIKRTMEISDACMNLQPTDYVKLSDEYKPAGYSWDTSTIGAYANPYRSGKESYAVTCISPICSSLPDTQDESQERIAATNDTLKEIVEREIEKYGNNADLNHIDVSSVTNMDGLFQASRFNGDISKWYVGNVKTMVNMFAYSDFNGDISGWDVSSLVDATGMFQHSKFNGDISNWNVKRLKIAKKMFASSAYNHDLCWNTSNVEDMSYMFACSVFNKYIGHWNVGSVRKMCWMFAFSKYNLPLAMWNVENVCDAEHMFTRSSFSCNIVSWRHKLKNLDDLSRKTMFEESLLPSLFSDCDPLNGVGVEADDTDWKNDIRVMETELNDGVKEAGEPFLGSNRTLPLKVLCGTITNDDGTKSFLNITESFVGNLPKIKVDKDYSVTDFDPTNYDTIMLDNGYVLKKLNHDALESELKDGNTLYALLYANAFISGTVSNVRYLGASRIDGRKLVRCTLTTELGDFHITQDNMFVRSMKGRAAKKNKEVLRFVKSSKDFAAGGKYFVYNELIKKSRRKVYELKKCIYSINDYDLNMLVMKQVKGERGRKFTLTLNDCRHLGIEFEPGLEVFPMELSWCYYDTLRPNACEDMTASPNNDCSRIEFEPGLEVSPMGQYWSYYDKLLQMRATI